MSESVSGVDKILAGLREKAMLDTWVDVGGAEGGTRMTIVPLADAEAAVHATVREIETWLRGEAENPSDEGPAFWLANFNGYDGTNSKADARVVLTAAADEIARRFGGSDA